MHSVCWAVELGSDSHLPSCQLEGPPLQAGAATRQHAWQGVVFQPMPQLPWAPQTPTVLGTGTLVAG